MKKITLISFCVIPFFLISTEISAQTAQPIITSETSPTPTVAPLKIGYINSILILNSLQEKKEAAARLKDLNQKYKDELKLMQDDYNKKYADFISYQNTMADNIKLRRMQELTELEKNINSFILVSQNDIDNQEKTLIEPLKAKIKVAVKQVGLENGYICIYDIASPSVAFLTPQADNLDDLVIKTLNQQ